MWNVYPYKNLTDLNLDFILKAIGEMENQVKNFVAINAIKYADPIQWDITRSYEKNTVVIDGHSGVAYISVAPVPYGVALTRPEYWTVVFDLSMFITKGAANFANSYESQPTTTATMDTNEGEWVVWDSTLFEALTDIHAGDAYVVDGNIKRMTVEDFYNILFSALQSESQTRADEDARIELSLTDLITSKVGIEAQTRADEDARIELSLTDLITSKVGIEAQTRADEDARIELSLTDLITSKVGIEAQTRADEDTRIEGIIGIEAQTRADEDTRIEGIIGHLSDLQTTDKDSIVDAINEVNGRALGNLDKADIRNYGGVADGVTDNTQAFYDCLADNNVVYLPRYNSSPYYFASKIVLDSAGGYTIKGDEATAITAPNVGDLFEIKGGFITIENLRIDTVSNIFYLNSVDNEIAYINISNIVATHANMFMHDNAAATNRITNLYVDKCYSFQNVSFGVYMTKAFAFIFFNNVTIIEIGTVATQACFNFENCEGLHMTHCEAEGGLTDGTHTGHMGFRFVNCLAIWLERCMADTVDSHGFVFSNSSYVYMNSCVSSLCGGHGIAILGTASRRYLITNCYIGGRNTLAPSPAGAHGIYNYNDEVSVTNCEIAYMTGYAIANNSQGSMTRYTNITCHNCSLSFYSSAGVGVITGLISGISGDAPVWGSFNHVNNLVNGVFS